MLALAQQTSRLIALRRNQISFYLYYAPLARVIQMAHCAVSAHAAIAAVAPSSIAKTARAARGRGPPNSFFSVIWGKRESLLLSSLRPPVVGRIATQNRVTHLGSDRTGLSLMENSVFLRVTSCFGVFGIGQTCSRNLARKPLMHLVHTTPLAAARAREELWFVLS